ncbi:AI-2E family transporter [Methylobacterium gossipiicola]|uniref:Predicted PurR-regulated permease PerM n=1 Tax=Methylobacterium gossipiicola TaxID=582675 RepID=A0A1I2W5E9_9HYPH|nr:AI-2E family transporter [Methylobacterium gossipiicola]SFG96658.1 Predicted PurR-regulated permease PerM [Methylobacterium gossipiicola]
MAPRPTRIPAAGTPTKTVTSPLIVAALIVTGLYLGRDVLIPIAIAILLSFVLGPLVNFLRRLHFGRFLSVAVSVLMTLSVVGALGALIGVQLADIAHDVPRYRTTIEHKLEGLQDSPAGRMADYVASIGRTMHRDDSKPKPETEAKPDAPPPDRAILVEVKDRAPDALTLAGTLLSPILHPLATIGIVFVVLLFLLMQREDLRDRMIRLAGSSDLHRTTVAMDDAAKRLSRYFLVQLALNASFGLVVGIGLYLIGVPSPVLWGIFSALMRFVPYIGAFVSALFPLALAAAVDPGWSMVVETLILFVILEPLVGHFIEPMLYGHSTGMSPFAVLVSALFWTWLWGPVGLLLSTPLTVCLVVLGRHVDKLEFLDVLFGDRPALTPVENFYQRILAGDPDEVQEHAELFLKTAPLVTYYDEVVIKGLELAARDAARGVLTPEQKTDIRQSLSGLVEDLADHEDAAGDGEDSSSAAPTASRDGLVLCVAGRSFVDGAACAILAQLLGNRGIGARLVPFSDVARARIDGFDPGAARIVCIVSTAISGEPTHLRRLAERMKRKLPQAHMVVGLWQADENGLDEAAQRRAIPADMHVTSLRGAVEAIVVAADPNAPAPRDVDRPAPHPVGTAIPA